MKGEVGEILHYGEQFYLKYISPTNECLFLSSPPGPALSSSRGSRRQETLLDETPSTYSYWKVLPNNVLHRWKPEDPVPVS